MTESRAVHIIRYAESVEQFTLDQYAQDSGILTMTDAERHTLINTISRLVCKGKLQSLRKGVYALSQLNVWRVVLNEQEQSVYNLIHEQYPLIRLCVYNGETFAPLQHHLAFNQATYIEVERDSAESVFHQLLDAGYEAYCRPDEQMTYD